MQVCMGGCVCRCVCMCFIVLYLNQSIKIILKGGPQVIRAAQGVITLTLRILRISVGDPKLPLYGSLYRGIATDH